jgi:hypothetical protein
MEDILDCRLTYGLCPRCRKGYLVKEIFYEGVIFNRRKVIVFYCPYCSFKNKHILKINEMQFQKEID